MNLTPQTRKQQFYQEIGRILMERPEKGTNNDDENVFKFIRFDLSVLDAVIKIFEPKTVEDLHKLINCFCSESYSFKVDEDVTTLVELAKSSLDFNSGFIPEEEKEKYIDFKSIGKVVQKNDNGIFTKYGYFFYDGENEDIIRMCDELKTDKPM